MDTRHIPWWNRLGVRLALAITLISVLTFSVFLLLVLRSQRRHLLEQARHTAAVVSDTINSSIHYDMLHDRREEAYLIMSAVGAQSQVEHLRIFDATGRIRFSTDAGEVGQVPDLRSTSCSPCHGDGQARLPLEHPRAHPRVGPATTGRYSARSRRSTTSRRAPPPRATCTPRPKA